MATQDQAGFIDVTSDDANRQQQVARTFYLLGNFFEGIDSTPRMEPGNVNNSGILGPQQSSIDVGVGQGGEVFIRGRAGQVGATQNAPKAAPMPATMAGLMGFIASPLGLLMLAGGVWWFARSK